MSRSLAPFFIMGCKRSGTTLVSQILDSHSRLAVYHESFFYPIFRPQLAWYGNLGRPANLGRLIDDMRAIVRLQGYEPPLGDAIRRRLVSPTFEGVLSTVLLLHAELQGKIRGGDKTPEQHAFLPEILERLPDSPVVFLMRDPRDTAMSIQKTFGVSLEDAARSWNAAVASYQRTSDRVHLVRYEELVQRPEAMVRSIASAVGEEYEPAMLNFFERVPEAWTSREGGAKLGGPMVTSAVGNYREMAPEAIWEIEEACAAGMDAMGYERTFPRQVGVSVPAPIPEGGWVSHLVNRLRYYGFNRLRWTRGLARWRLMLRLRLRYLALLGPLRRDW